MKIRAQNHNYRTWTARRLEIVSLARVRLEPPLHLAFGLTRTIAKIGFIYLRISHSVGRVQQQQRRWSWPACRLACLYLLLATPRLLGGSQSFFLYFLIFFFILESSLSDERITRGTEATAMRQTHRTGHTLRFGLWSPGTAILARTFRRNGQRTTTK